MSTTLREVVDGAKHLTNEYKVGFGNDIPSDEEPKEFLNRVCHDYFDRLAYLDEKGYFMISIFCGEGEMDNIHDEKRGDHYYKFYIRDIL